MSYFTGEQCQRPAITHLCVSPLIQTIKTDGEAKSWYRQAQKVLISTFGHCNFATKLQLLRYTRQISKENPQIHQFYSLKITV
ncbi:MAG: hypothetical protein EBV05_14470, partial [Cyanobacteria bacterium WB6_1B_304]|nr:hypothetical protein [Cyanobacteria bacterium WB6_1B_304]